MNEMNLYEIDNALQILEDNFDNIVDTDTGEILDKQLLDIYNSLQIAEDKKMTGIANIIQKQDDMVEIISKRIKDLQAMKKIAENKKERLKRLLDGVCMGNKWENSEGTVKIGYRKSVSTDIYDVSKLDEKFMKVEVVKTPMKDEIKKAIQGGEKVDGARLVENNNIQIKVV